MGIAMEAFNDYISNASGFVRIVQGEVLSDEQVEVDRRGLPRRNGGASSVAARCRVVAARCGQKLPPPNSAAGSLQGSFSGGFAAKNFPARQFTNVPR
jgi:hypothetical protein